MASSPEILNNLQRRVEGLGLTWLGVADLGPEPDFARYIKWIHEKRHAGMGYLESNLEIRRDPRALLPGAKSVILVALGYYLGDKLRPRRNDEPPRIAQYARLRDYHRELRKRAETVARDIREHHDNAMVGTRVVVDSAPILERALAARAGGGFIGKNTCFISPNFGSWLLLAEILSTVALPASSGPEVDASKRSEVGGCGTCRRCQVYCPTGALDHAYSLDANRCIAYWTIEHRGLIPEAIWPWLGQYYFGCDICQLACPYNRSAVVQNEQNLVKIATPPSLFEVAIMNQSAYERLFAGTPMTRAKRHGLKRNALIAMAVTKDSRLDEAMDLAVMNEPESVVADTVAQIQRWRENQ